MSASALTLEKNLPLGGTTSFGKARRPWTTFGSLRSTPTLRTGRAIESDRGIELRARDRQRKLIAKIDAALERIEDGSYGFCEETGEPIGVKRLDARPVATLSLEAQERHERRERIYRDD